jgi:hypothetical protein
MKLFAGLIALTFGVAIAAVAGFFSVTGLAALFAAAFWPIIAMGGVLESGKIVAAGWLHANWLNPHVSVLHKTYLISAIGALMLITAIGIYGFLAKSHLDQEVPLGTVTLQISQRQQQIDTDRDNIKRLNDRQTQLDAAVNSLIQQNFVLRSQSLRNQQKIERGQIATDLLAGQQDIDRLSRELLPLRMQTNDVDAKLGPVKYVAELFGWSNPDTAVRMVILILMFAFDPLAVVLVLSGCISMREWFDRAENPTPSEELHQQPIAPVIVRSLPQSDDKQTILAMLRRNPGIVEDVIDTVLEWHEQHR